MSRSKGTRASRREIGADGEPTPAALRAIEAEWPLIEAELAVVDAEIAAARAGDDMDELDRRRVRRSQAARTRAMVEAARRSPEFGDAA